MIELKNLMDTEILNYFRQLPDNTITKAMTYSMSIGGKRLRPILCLLTGELFGKSTEDLIPMALASLQGSGSSYFCINRETSRQIISIDM